MKRKLTKSLFWYLKYLNFKRNETVENRRYRKYHKLKSLGDLYLFFVR